VRKISKYNKNNTEQLTEQLSDKSFKANKLKVFYDTASYYEGFADTIQNARDSIIILGWDIHSKLKLRRDEKDYDYPIELGELLNELCQRNKNLKIYVLVWDFALIYLLERELFPRIQFEWKTHRNIKFIKDSSHGIGVSHHQKIVVVDNKVAFVGGIDLAPQRWDTWKHLPEDKRRKDPRGNFYTPFHDMQAMLEGPVARQLADIAIQRWKRATKKKIKITTSEKSPWPANYIPDMENVNVNIARTYGKWKNYPEVREIESMYIRQIEMAKKYIYIENQYLSSNIICDTLLNSLSKKEGPEIVIIQPKELNGWLEKKTIGLLRDHVVKKLREADKHKRLLILYPAYRDSEREVAIHVHAKIAFFDNEIFRIGSANLSNRSMGVDSECDIIVAANNKNIQNTIKNMRNKLLSNHLSIEQALFDKELLERKSLIATINNLKGKNKTLIDFIPSEEIQLSDNMPKEIVADPESPIKIDEFISELNFQKKIKKKSFYFKVLKILLVIGIIFLIWKTFKLEEYTQPKKVVEFFEPHKDGLAGFFIIMLFYIIGGLVIFPITLIIIITALLFDPIYAFFYAIIGSLISSYITYFLGEILFHDIIRKLAGNKIHVLNKYLKKQSILIIAGIRLLPVAPFSIINMICGATKVKPLIFIIGTAIGMFPGILGLTVFSVSIIEIVKNPNIYNISTSIFILLMFLSSCSISII